MKMLVYEFHKTIRLRYVGYTLLILSLASMIWFAVSAFNGGPKGHFSAAAYRQMVDDLLNVSTTGISNQDAQTLLALLQEEEEYESKDGYTGDLYTNNITEELWLYQQVIAELEQIAGYEDYLNSVQASYERTKSVSLFNGSDTPNARKTAADFAAMENVEVEFIGSLGIELFLQTDFWSASLLMTAFVLIAGLLLMEMEGHSIQLLHCTVKGKYVIVYVKYCTGALILTADLLFGAICRLAVVATAYGTAGWEASIQSVYGAQSCTLKISILEAMLLFIGIKLLALLAIYSLLFLFALLLRKSTLFYLVGLGVILISYMAYQMIDSNSFLSGLKFFNPAAFLYTESLLLDYKNFTLLGTAISYMILMEAVSLLMITLCLVFAGKLFAGLPTVKKSKLRRFQYANLEQAVSKLTGGNTLFGFENRKWLFYQNGIFVCIALVLCVAGLSPTVSERLYEKEEIYYKYYVKQVEGTYTEEKMNNLYEELARLEDIALTLEEEGSSYTDAALMYYQQQLERRDGLELAIAYGEYLAESGGSFVYAQGYENLLGLDGTTGKNYLFIYRTIALAVIDLLAGLLWGIEQRTHMDVMLHISALGTNRINCRKLQVILFMGLLVGGCVYLPWIANVYSVFGMEQILQPACSLEIFAGIPAEITLIHILLFFYLLHIAYLWITAMLLHPIEQWIGNSLIAQLLVFAFGMIPILIAR